VSEQLTDFLTGVLLIILGYFLNLLTNCTVSHSCCCLLTLPAYYTAQRLCNDRMSVRPFLCLVDRHLPLAVVFRRGQQIGLSIDRAAAVGSVMLRAEV